MKKVIIGILTAGITLAGYFYYVDVTTPIVYVKTVDDEVTQLETELETLNASLEAGNLSPEVVIDTQARLIKRIEAIQTATASMKDTSLSAVDKQRLQAGLTRLTQVLVTYRDTLVELDRRALTIASDSKDTVRTSVTRRLVEVIAATTESVESNDIEVENIDEVVTAVLDEVNQNEDMAEEENSDQMDDGSNMDDSSMETEDHESMTDDETSTSTDDDSGMNPEDAQNEESSSTEEEEVTPMM